MTPRRDEHDDDFKKMNDRRDTEISLRRYVEQIFEERDRRYAAQFNALEKSFAAQLAAQDKSTQAAFLASDKAIIKAEDAQREYNARSNEFRGQLDDQAKRLIGRDEVQTIVKGFEEKVEAAKQTETKDIENLRAEIQTLREFRSALAGKETVVHDNRAQTNWSVGIIVTVCLSLLSLGISVLIMFGRIYLSKP
jgi:hypothetical protein